METAYPFFLRLAVPTNESFSNDGANIVATPKVTAITTAEELLVCH